jgi:hypothetical protein
MNTTVRDTLRNPKSAKRSSSLQQRNRKFETAHIGRRRSQYTIDSGFDSLGTGGYGCTGAATPRNSTILNWLRGCGIHRDESGECSIRRVVPAVN